MSSEADAGGANPGGPSPKTPGAAELGRLFGRFRLLDRIGAGDLSEVFRATVVGVQGFERRVAIKLMRPDVAEVEPGRLFAEEARVSAMLEHPSVVQVYEFGIIDSAPFIAMEYLRGRNLEQVMKGLRALGEGLPPALAVYIAQKVAAALSHAHELEDDRGHPMGIIHRDVTPANIMLVHEGAVKLLDFGVSRVVHDPLPSLSRNGRPLPRNLAYLSPEDAHGRPVDKRTDVFALGVVMWEMLTGRRLFAGKSDKVTVNNVARAEIPPPSRFAPDVPEALDQIVLTALLRDVDRRYRSAEVMAHDLDGLMQTLPSRHGDLPALLDRVGGSPRDTGPTRTLAGEPVRRPNEPRRPAETEENTTRQMGDNTLAAILAKEPRRRSGWARMLSDTRAFMVGIAGLVVGVLIAAAFLTGRTRLSGTPAPVATPPALAPPVAPAMAAPPPSAAPPVARPAALPVCGEGDAGQPCLPPAPATAAPTTTPPATPPTPEPAPEPAPSAEPKRAEGVPSPLAPQPPRKSTRHSSKPSPARKPAALDRQPNPFAE